jgi:hypothetical protein
MARRRAQDDENPESVTADDEFEGNDVDDEPEDDESGLVDDEDESEGDEVFEDDADFEDDEEDPDQAPLTLTGRISQAFGLPAKTRTPPPRSAQLDTMSDKEKADAIRRIDQLERRIGYGGAALAMTIGLVAFIPYIRDPTRKVPQQVKRVGKHCPEGYRYFNHVCNGSIAYSRSHWIIELIIVAVFALFLAIATWYGRRSLLAFSLVFAGLAVVQSTGSILGIAFVGAGGWLLVRAHRVQRYGTTSGKEVAAIAAEQRAERNAAKKGATGGGTKPTTSKAPSRPSAARTTKSKKATPDDGKRRPEANKRYTPKTPPRKRPVPPST